MPSQPIPPPSSHGVTSSTDVPLYWAKYGPESKPPVLVLHGGPGAHHDYLLPQMLALAALQGGRELLFYDQRGGGRSKSGDREPITWRTHVGDLAAIVRELEMQGAPLVGYSWGGMLALLYAAESRRDASLPKPASLLLIDPAPISRQYRGQFEREFARRQAGPDVGRLRTELAESHLRERDLDAYRQRNFELSVAGYFADPRSAQDLTPFRVSARVQQSVWDSMGDFDLASDGRLASIRLPTLIVHGREDPIPLASSEQAAEIMNAKLVVLENCGHVPYVEQPAGLFAAIDAFVANSHREPSADSR
jgi:proline iminopeptidase